MFYILAAVLGLWSLVSCGVSSPQPLGAGSGDANAAFAAQKVDVDFVAAWSRYQRGDRTGSGRYLDKAAATLKQQGGNTGAIKSLAQRVKSGDSVSEKDFDETFAGSHRAMAQYHRGQADRLIAGQQEQAAGASMEASAYHFERSAQWSGQPLSPQEQQEVSNLRRVGDALQTGSGYLVKGSGYLVEGTGWVLGKGFNLLTRGGERTQGTAGNVMFGTGRGGETGSRWIESAGGGIRRFGDWILRR
ncbi:hypothetical protein [Roseibacillus persicicus]|uniref:Uncharacterized protein n=1 Tax=Roseibacillus persicicus TaxID=454148 RepID=A0A918TN36_9BACT|nr:hypothetical protein [Roseibacillus persicicus]MDQ8189418.1 hypothetical protein [Roseibacillus persicicus]GHC55480.1 hypothetical protein GCM10007100_22590 [Roseibacillus persicicus]